MTEKYRANNTVQQKTLQKTVYTVKKPSNSEMFLEYLYNVE
jgi:hypothetical protein